jgi:hypothetical protein
MNSATIHSLESELQQQLLDHDFEARKLYISRRQAEARK